VFLGPARARACLPAMPAAACHPIRLTFCTGDLHVAPLPARTATSIHSQHTARILLLSLHNCGSKSIATLHHCCTARSPSHPVYMMLRSTAATQPPGWIGCPQRPTLPAQVPNNVHTLEGGCGLGAVSGAGAACLGATRLSTTRHTQVTPLRTHLVRACTGAPAAKRLPTGQFVVHVVHCVPWKLAWRPDMPRHACDPLCSITHRGT
jgi:hypothetical protein